MQNQVDFSRKGENLGFKRPFHAVWALIFLDGGIGRLGEHGFGGEYDEILGVCRSEYRGNVLFYFYFSR